jgi:hypothetical protein
MAADRSLFHNYHKIRGYVRVANNAIIQSVGIGDVNINTVVGGRVLSVTLQGVLHVPDLAANLLSQDQLVYEAKLAIQHDSVNGLRITDKTGAIVGVTSRINKQQILNTTTAPNTAYISSTDSRKRQRIDSSEDLQTWHNRLGHLHYDAVRKLAKGYATGIAIKEPSPSESTPCISCIYGKQHRKPNKTPAKRKPLPLNLVHTDVCGPIRVPSLSGYKYFVSFTDDKTRHSMVYFLRQKDQVLKAFKEYKALVEKQLSLKIKAVRSDRGREYVGAEMIEFLAAEGILLQTTGRYSPDQNGVSERLNRTLLGRARAMLYEAGLGKEF